MSSDDRNASPYTAPSESPSSLLALLKRRYFRRMWSITTVSSLGDWLGVFALTFYVKNISGHAEFAVGGVLLFRVIPGLFFGPFAGVLADRFDRRRLMVTADLCRAALIASIPWMHAVWELFVVSAVMEVLGLMWAPSKDATIPNLVDRSQLMTANQLSLITTYATFPMGGALVALLAIPAAVLAHFHAPGAFSQSTTLAFFVDAGTFLFSASMVATFPAELMRTKRALRQVGNWNPLSELLEGFRFIRRSPIVRTLVVSAWMAFSGGSAVISLGPIFAGRIVRGGEAAGQAAWGALIIAVGIGLVGGMITAGWIARRVEREYIFPFGLTLSGTLTVVTASMTAIKPTIVSTVFVGFGAGIAWVTIYTLLQERTDDRLRGRTFATLYTGIQLSLFIGLGGWPILAGLVGDHTVRIGAGTFDVAGVRVALWGGGLGLVVSGVTAWRAMHGKTRRRAARLRGLRLSQGVSGGARSGLFIAFEGGEGAGKSTHIELLSDWLRQQGKHVTVTREPGGTAIAEEIRRILLNPATKEMDPKTETLLFAAGRAQHVAEVIRPALERNDVVLCDRYVDSSIAYQGLARGLGEDDVLHLNVWATDELLPDVVVLLHVDPEKGLARTGGRRDRMEQEELTFHRKVNEAYLHLAREYPSRFSVVDASGTIEQVQGQIRTAILPFLQEVTTL
ncbi:MAG: dTMP kinase [Actinobacteria bacterium]|nr:dTMP kinase [Actinomycetota bacterium]